MNAKGISAIYPLSPLQQGMLFQTIYAPEAGAYVEQFVCTLRGELDEESLRLAWQQTVDRHDVLRTAFVWEEVDEPLQVVGERAALVWEREDWRGLTQHAQRERLETLLDADRRRGFDLTRAPLMRLTLIDANAGESYFVWSHHHLLLDGWSVSLLMREVSEQYQALRRGVQPRLERPRPFREYIAWLRQQDAARAEAFWREALEGVSVPTPLGVWRSASVPHAEAKGYGERETHLSSAVTSALQTQARRHKLTLNTLLQGAWALLLARYSNTDDVVFGSVVSGRPAELPGVESMVGMFINTLPVRVHVPKQGTLLDWLRGLQSAQAEARQYEHTSLIELPGWAGLPRGQSMFESVLVFANYPVEPGGGQQGARLEIRDPRLIETNDMPLTLEAAPGPELKLKVVYDERRFDEQAADLILGHWMTALASMAEGLDRRPTDVRIITAEERSKLLSELSARPLDGQEDGLAHRLFEAQVEADPGGVAVSFDGEEMSYAELNRRSNQIAHGLRVIAVEAGRPVALMLGGGPLHVAALIGVLKAGCPFVCLDPNYPAARLEQILEEIDAACLISDAASLKSHAPIIGVRRKMHGMSVVTLDAGDARAESCGVEGVIDGAGWFETCPATNPASVATPQDLAYIVFTSGSTGRPKGIMQPHRSFCQFLTWQSDYFGITRGKRVAQWASLTYDASYCEVFGALCFGATLCLTSAAKRYDPAALVEWVRAEKISLLQTVPSFCRQVINVLDSKFKELSDPWPSLEHMLLAGELLSVDLARAWLRRHPRSNKLYNLYGPSEMVLATYYPVEDVRDGQLSIPVGRAIGGRQILILDEDQRLCPVGVTGEIYVRSRYLTSGYWQRPEETEKAYIQNPLHEDYPDPVYRTGDLGRWLPDGNIEFGGRKDFQVKVRGMRVEIEDIESALRQHELVGECAVAAHRYDDNDQRLAAYVVLKPQTEKHQPGSGANGTAYRAHAGVEASREETLSPPETRLRSFLKTLLPEHMIPSAFVFAETLPRTRTGKLDRKALPRPELRRHVEQSYVAPRTPLEAQVAVIWRDLLKVDRVGVEDNFFELGGHSILALQALNRMREQCGVDLPLRSFFDAPTVAAMAQQADAARDVEDEGQRLFQLLEQVRQLTPDEAGAMLRRKRESST
jgi:amino acid adenylation domain-containing protein